jgi:hypothetical protein
MLHSFDTARDYTLYTFTNTHAQSSSLTRGRVCNVLLLLVLVRAFPLGSESRGTQDHILLSQLLRLPQPGGPGPRI